MQCKAKNDAGLKCKAQALEELIYCEAHKSSCQACFGRGSIMKRGRGGIYMAKCTSCHAKFRLPE